MVNHDCFMKRRWTFPINVVIDVIRTVQYKVIFAKLADDTAMYRTKLSNMHEITAGVKSKS